MGWSGLAWAIPCFRSRRRNSAVPPSRATGRTFRSSLMYFMWEHPTSQSATCSVVDSHAKISALLARVRASLESALACGESSGGSSSSALLPTSSSRTSPPCERGGSTPSSPTLPRSGTFRGGIVYPLPPSAPLTGETGSSSWPTATASDKGMRTRYAQGGTALSAAVRTWPTPTCSEATGAGHRAQGGKNLRTVASEESSAGGPLNPEWVEQLMGFPAGWTGGPHDQERGSTNGKPRAARRKEPPPTEQGD